MQINKRVLFLSGGGFLFLLGLWMFLGLEAFPGHAEFKGLLMKNLTRSEPVPIASYNSSFNSSSVIYVLGGAPRSLKYRFKTASDLYKSGVAKRILIDSQEMMMGYNPLIRRNLTFNEWAVEKLTALGVKKEDIESVPIENLFFGTFSEATSISNIALKRGYKSLILVTSSYHTLRTWASFSKFIKNHDLNLYIYMSNDYHDLRALSQEYLKLKVYQLFLL